VQTPGVTRNLAEYLEYIAKPRPFKDLVSACAIAPGA
jgi:hypothetical protein